MIRLIISNIERYKKWSGISLMRKNIFFDLRKLDQINDEALFFKAINQVKLKNGIYKTTKANRFTDVDAALVTMIGTNANCFIHDVAVSDGITSVNLYDKLKANNINTSLDISDKFAIIYCEKKWYGASYKDADGEVLFNDFFGLQTCRHTSNRFIITKLLGYLFPAKSSIKNSDNEILMLNPQTSVLIREGKITFSYYDIFEKATRENKYDIVRCMNVLNYKVFPDDAIVQAVINLTSTVKEDGLFVLGRTQDGTGINNVSIFKKRGTHLSTVKEINSGSEVKFLLKDILLN